MSVYGVNNPLLSSLGTVGRPGPGGAGQVRPGQTGGVHPGQVRPGAARPAATPAQPAAVRPQQPLTGPTNARPAEAPPGTDPELWSVLTGEERAYFAKAATMGPLTYGRIAAGVSALNGGMQQAAPAARGVRLDVRA
jgi:translation initiation factor IF-2